jgi:asparagine synthase (glutamine-hydrolysing)
MCGIAGIVSSNLLPPDAPQRARVMRDLMIHRGPDEAGLHADAHAVLAHRRLSIVDLASGQQPLANETGDVWVTYNGEIYNHREIRAQLESRGHRYRTSCDTETIVHAYEEWGDDCMLRFRGMFAFGVWDARRRRLLLVRDRLGIKPLYWAMAGDMLLFASEIKSILASGLVEARVNGSALPELLSTRYISGEETLFEGIHKLLPGHRLVLEDGRIRQEQYWDISAAIGQRRETATNARLAVHQFRELLEQSVRLRLMSDVPLGVFLSGGIDSSAIAALMARMIDRPLQTFSVAFGHRAFSELEYSRQMAAAIGAETHEVVIDDRDFFDALPRLVWHEDEPIAHPSSVPLYFVSQLARKKVTVVLTGEGSDELLAGYGKYPRILWNWRAAAMYERVCPSVMRGWIAREVVPRLPGRLGRVAGRTFLGMRKTPDAMCFDNFAAIRVADMQRLLAGEYRQMAQLPLAYASSRRHFDHPGAGSTLLDRVLYADMKTYLVELLMKQDQMSMAASIESRVPFLDHVLVEFAAALPDAMKLSGWRTKRVLREAMKDVLPQSVLKRPKMGFPVPFGEWMKVLDSRSRQRGIVDAPAVEALLQDHASGRTDGSARLWTLLNLELWQRTFIDGGGIQSMPIPAPTAAEAGNRSNHHAAAVAMAGPQS